MNRETIKSVAEKFCTTQDGKNLIRVGVSGYLKSVWHDASEKPECRDVIVETEIYDGKYSYECWGHYDDDWEEDVHYWGVTRWAYVADILPERN